MTEKRVMKLASRGKRFGAACIDLVVPLIGYLLVHTVVETFTSLQKFIPWIALALLSFIGGKMLYEGFSKKEKEEKTAVGFWALMLQGIATSIDALSVGFTIATLPVWTALVEAAIIGVVTLVICLGGLRLGRVFGVKLAGKATILGGFILIFIGLEIFLTGIL